MQRRFVTSMERLSTLFLIAFAASFFSLAGCDKSDEKSGGPAEKAGATMGRAVDRAVENAGPVRLCKKPEERPKRRSLRPSIT
jgi:hypothetical protein